jgi:beta-glucanase (GH16 family)
VKTILYHSPNYRALTIHLSVWISLAILLSVSPASGSLFCPAAQAADPSVWSLAWSDEFNGSALDPANWVMETGGSGWGNNELESYTNRSQNAYLENGSLVIKAIKESYTGPDGIARNYTSARLITKNKFTQTYGRFEARIKIPYGQGVWPAFWMLGSNIDSAGWPTCGEIDIMENIGKEPSTVHGTIHGPGYSGANGIGAPYSLTSGQKFADDYHTFSVEWEPNVLRFYVDGILYTTRTPADLPSGKTWVYDHPFFIILNLAIGGYWPGNPDDTTVFPQTMKVDYVRVYSRAAQASAPVLLTEEGSNRALALDSVTWQRDPFSIINTYNFSQDQRTRVSLLLANADLVPGDTASVATAQAQDSQGQTYPLSVEYVGRLPSFDWITHVIARLPDQLGNVNDPLISINFRGQSSNKAFISIKH